MHWKFRLWKDGQVNESPKVGEPYWDDVRNRVGIATVGDIFKWFPRLLTGGLRVNPGDNLTGMTDDQTENLLVLDFNTPNEIRVVDKANNNNVVARITQNAAFFTNASVTGTYGFGGLINQVINGALNIGRTFPGGSSISSNGTLSCLVAPNWQAWCSKNNGGDFIATLDSTDVPPGCANSIKVVVGLPCYSGGIRTFIHSIDQFIGRQACFSLWLKGPSGTTQSIRIRTETVTLALKTITGTGAWVRYSIPLDFNINPMPDGSTFIAIDALYAPTYATIDNPWRVGGVQANYGLNAVDLEMRSKETEKALLQGIYYSGKHLINTTECVAFDMLPNFITTEVNNATITTTDLDNTGAIFESSGSTLIKCNIMAYRLPTINE